MKRLLSVFALVAVLLPSMAFAQEAAWTMTAFRSDLTVDADGTLHVEEAIGAEFIGERHGIWRYLPVEGKDDRGEAYRLEVELLGAMLDGEPVPVESSREDGKLVWRIGDPDVTLTGEHEYVLRYDVLGAIGRFEDFDEIYWNATGEGWDVPLPAATAVVSLPDGVLSIKSACYTGAYGSTEQECYADDSDGVVGVITAREGLPLTVAVAFPKGAVAEPAPKKAPNSALPFLAALLPIGTLAFMYRRWKRHGSDRGFGATVTQYEPPQDLRPAEAAALLHQSVTPSALSVTLVDLATRGYLRFEAVEGAGVLGTSFGSTKDHVIHLVKAYHQDAGVRPFEAALLDALFGKGAVIPTQTSIALLRGRFHKAAAAFRKGLMEHLVREGNFTSNPSTVRAVHVGIGVALLVIGFLLMGTPFGWAVILSGPIVIGFGMFMAQWSAKGRAAAAHVIGHKAFITAVEKHRAPWMETQDMFSKTLPYAMAFGLGAHWAKAFAPLQLEPPSWYRNAALGAAWSPVPFEKSLSGLSASLGALSVSPRSGGSGSSGGFSGGGSGGGGGGSW